MKLHPPLLMKALAVAAALAAAAAGIRKAGADVVSAQGRAIAVDVQVTSLRDGLLTYRTSAGQEVTRPVEQIRYLQITGWTAFNQAEKHQREGQAKAATEAYEKCLQDLEAAPPDGGIDRRLLVQCRVVALYEAQGRFDRAVAAYLDVLDRMPACVDALRPRRVPRTADDLLKNAAGHMDRFLSQRDRLDPVAGALEKWRAGWPHLESQETRASEEPGAIGRLAIPRVATQPADMPWNPVLVEVRSSLEKGACAQALQRLRDAEKQIATSMPPELSYWQGRAYACLAGTVEGAERAAGLRRAGIAFLRVAVLSPDHPLAAESLYRAAEICRDEGRADRAAVLLAELVQSRPEAAPWAQRAREQLSKLRSTASAPAR